MNENLLSIEPKLLWKNFRELTLIPHPSKHEEQITEFLLQFGKQHAHEAFRDEAGNVIFRKNATPGMENRKGIILQAHCDMVPQANADKQHNFLTDPITTIVKDGYVMADGTTLGADDGIGVAAIMSVFEDETIAHGPIEALITVDEETGLTGAVNLKSGMLEGKTLINLDSEEHGIFYIGCAGGVNVNIGLPIEYEEPNEKLNYYRLSALGFLGGHSGCDIHKNRPNASKILFRFLDYCLPYLDFYMGDFGGGNMHNAIPREAFAEIAIPDYDDGDIDELIEEFNEIIQSEYGNSDPDGRIEIKECEEFRCCSEKSWFDVHSLINTLPSGVFAMSADIPGLVETSNNLSVVKVENGILKIQCLLRSSVQTQSDYLKRIIETLSTKCDANVEFEGEYPGWKPNPNSEILEISKKVFNDNFGQEPQVTAIHAGLECGMIIDKYPGMDAISIGPDMSGVHTPTEKIEIESCGKFMQLLADIIKNAPERD